MIHLTKSDTAKKFFKEAGITIDKDSCHNHIVLKHGDKTLELWAESEYSVAAGIPGIYIDDNGLCSLT